VPCLSNGRMEGVHRRGWVETLDGVLYVRPADTVVELGDGQTDDIWFTIKAFLASTFCNVP